MRDGRWFREVGERFLSHNRGAVGDGTPPSTPGPPKSTVESTEGGSQNLSPG